MNARPDPEFKALLHKVRSGEAFTPAEEAAWGKALQTPEGANALEQALAADVAAVGSGLRAKVAMGAEVPVIAPELAERLVREQVARSADKGAVSGRLKKGTMRGSRGWWALAGLAAALLCAAIWWRPEEGGEPRVRVEFAWVVSPGGLLRGGEGAWTPPAGVVGVEQVDQAALRAWTEGLPGGVIARVWIDEEAGVLRVRWRNAAGVEQQAEEALGASAAELSAQLSRWRERLAAGGD